jgi:Dihydrofolate reductase
MPAEVILIAATTIDGFIARHSLEVTSWSEDLQLFKEQTMGHPILMGSNTFKNPFKRTDG